MNALILKPVTYMNIIGKNVAKAMKNERIEKTSLIVIHDDLEQKIGRVRAVKGTSFKGHNGLKSISQELGGFKDFLRFQIGIGRPEARDQNLVADYVLSNFN
jgi:PTH1 family peptidyl-tRNA hydrolase